MIVLLKQPQKLHPTDISQISSTAKYMAKDIQFDTIYISPDLQPVVKKYIDSPIVQDDLLVGLDRGILTGKSKEEINKILKEFKKGQNMNHLERAINYDSIQGDLQKQYKSLGVETSEEMYRRIDKFFFYYKKIC